MRQRRALQEGPKGKMLLNGVHEKCFRGDGSSVVSQFHLIPVIKLQYHSVILRCIIPIAMVLFR